MIVIDMTTELDIRREIEILRILKLFHGLDFIVVGGYAVDAYTLHRFSVDLDIVVGKKDFEKFRTKQILTETCSTTEGFEKFEAVLEKEGYLLKTQKKDLDEAYSGEFRRYVKDVGGKVSVDFLIGSLVARATGASWSFEFLKKNSQKRLVKGLTESIEAEVPSKELLVALKIHSGRLTDLRDIVMLSADIEKEKIPEMLARGDITALKKIVDKFISNLNGRNFVDSLKGTFNIAGMGRKPDPSETMIKKTHELLDFVGRKIQE